MKNNTKILLINPPGTNLIKIPPPPLGLLYLAGTLLEAGFETKLVDGCVDGWNVIEKTIKSYHPTIVGISCFTPARKKSLKVARIVKKIDRNILVILGGMHATHMYEQIFSHYSFVDICVRGEGEKTLLEIVQGKNLFEIKGIAFRDNKKIVTTPLREYINNLDELPFPAWQLLDFKKYPIEERVKIINGVVLNNTSTISLIFSRGCVGHCNFCSVWQVWGRYRYRSAKNMVDEIELLYTKFNINNFKFVDDLFTMDRRAVLDLCKEIINRNLRITFLASTRADCVDEEILMALKKAGCYRISYGVESAAPKILKRMNKPINLDVYRKAIALTKKVGIKTLVLLINGYFGESIETVNQTIDFLNETNPDQIGTRPGVYIYPGTNDYQYCKKIGFINDDYWLSNKLYATFTGEHNRLTLIVFFEALLKRKKLSQWRIVNYYKFLSLRMRNYLPEPVRIFYHNIKVKINQLIFLIKYEKN